MDNRRFVLFVTLSLGILLTWQLVILPRIMPPQKPPAKPVAAAAQPPAQPAQPGAKPADKPAAKPADKPAAKPAEKPAAQPVAKPKPFLRTAAKPTEVALGAIDPKSGFRLLVRIKSLGATIENITLNDPRYIEETDRKKQLVVVGRDSPKLHSLDTELLSNGQPHPATKDLHHWEIVPGSQSESGVTYRFQWDGIELHKKFTLGKVDPQAPKDEKPAYQLRMDFTVRNLENASQKLQYVLTGPTGLPLDNRLYTSIYRDVIANFVYEDGSTKSTTIYAATIATKPEVWTEKLQYVGVNTQFFAALLAPVDDQIKLPYTDQTTQVIVPGAIPVTQPEHHDVTPRLTSVPIELAANGGAVTHSYDLFAGPKRDDLVDGNVLNLGWFGVIARLLLWVLDFFYMIFGNYGVAIICLTILVRLCILPLSIKQAKAAAKMQALQPEMAALREKFGDDKEKMAQAQMKLFSENNVNPLGGCLPIFIQMPVFIGLYQALYYGVQLRMAPFLWIKNLAAPEQLFPLGMDIPFIGQHFNLLPLVTIALFIVQQKLFTPPAVDDQAKQQMVMMNIMMVVMGVMFYKVAAGLCIYFITSSLWGIAERLLLPKAKNVPAAQPPDNRNDQRGGGGRGPDAKPPQGGGGLFDMLLKAADKERSIRREKAGNR